MNTKVQKFELPTYEEAQSRVFDGGASAIDWFICEHEPGNVVEQAKFRREVSELIGFAMKSAELACEQDWASRFKRENELHRQETKEFTEMLDRISGKERKVMVPDDRGLYEKVMTLVLMFVVAFIVIGMLTILTVDVVSKIGGGSSP